MDKKAADNIKRLLKDIDYCTSMKRLEISEQKSDFHIVPITGLIISRFTRLENELVTVKEVWEKKLAH